MSIDFGFIGHFFGDEIKLSPLQKFNVSVHRKLVMYKNHSNRTMGLYRKEYLEIHTRQRKEYKEAYAKAHIIYDELYNAIQVEDEDHEKHFYALHESGLSDIENNEALSKENLALDFREMVDYFNKSALVVLYALLESELRRLCALLKDVLKKRITLNDIEAGDYLNSIYKYLDKVIEIEMDDLLPFQNKFKDIQFLRNKIMHNGGEFPLDPNEELDRIVTADKELLFLEELEDENVRILRISKIDFVAKYYDLVHDFFGKLFWLIEKKLGFTTIIERTKFIFTFLSGTTSVELKENKPVSKGWQFVFGIDTHDDTIANFSCKLTITSSSKSTVEITNQLGKHEMLERLVSQLSNHPTVLGENIFQGFHKPETKVKIAMMLY